MRINKIVKGHITISFTEKHKQKSVILQPKLNTTSNTDWRPQKPIDIEKGWQLQQLQQQQQRMRKGVCMRGRMQPNVLLHLSATNATLVVRRKVGVGIEN